jgi:hypothetical protein
MPQFLFAIDSDRPVRSLAMTEGDEAFYERRIQEELGKASDAGNPRLKQLHLRWALLYQKRIDGAPKSVARSVEERLLDAQHQLEPLAALDEPECTLDAA